MVYVRLCVRENDLRENKYIYFLNILPWQLGQRMLLQKIEKKEMKEREVEREVEREGEREGEREVEREIERKIEKEKIGKSFVAKNGRFLPLGWLVVLVVFVLF